MDKQTFKKMAMVAGGNAYLSNNYKLPSSNTPLKLYNREMSKSEKTLDKSLNDLVNDPRTLAVLVYNKGHIIYEKYRKPVTESCPIFSWSMSKTLVGLSLGYLLYERKILDLNHPAKIYSKELEGTVYGESSIKNLLRMSSGVGRSITDGNQREHEWDHMKDGVYSTIEHIHQFPNKEFEAGKKFNYSGTDTEAICNIIDNNGGFLNIFQKYIWEPAKTENTGYWMLEKDNRVIAQAGFSATARDWIRIGLHTINELTNSNDIIKNYMIEATSKQIDNTYDDDEFGFNKTLKYYGYQTWVGDFGPSPSYWFAGGGGLRLGIDPINEQIIYVGAYNCKSDYIKNIYKVFKDLQELS